MQNALLTQEDPTLSVTELASRDFVNAVRQVQGIVSVQQTKTKAMPEQVVRVTVPDFFGEPALEVFRLEKELFRRYPNTDLRIEIEDVPPADDTAFTPFDSELS